MQITGEETNRGFHIMDMIIRNKHFDEAVFDKITIEDEYKNSGCLLQDVDLQIRLLALYHWIQTEILMIH